MKTRTLFTALAMALLLNSSAYALIENGIEGEMREDTSAPFGSSNNFYNALIQGMLLVLRV